MKSNAEVTPLPESGTNEVSPLLSAEAVERIKAKETAQVQAKAERQQKRSEAEKLADAVRREELRQIPRANRTQEEQREFAKFEARRRRAGKPKSDTLSDVEHAEQFWAANRLLVPAQKLKAWEEQEQRVLDILFWMNTGWEPQAPDFVSLEEGLATIDEHIATHGLIHDDVYQNHVLQDFAPAWGIWALQDIEDPIWKYVPAFFRDSERYNALCQQEGEATAVFAKLGIRIALPGYHVRKFKERISEHENKQHRNETNEKCWLCQFEQGNREAQP